jgi:serine/threonine-protein kinase
MSDSKRCRRCGAAVEAAEPCAACLFGVAMVLPEPPDLEGERFGPYAIGRVLGQGGMGVVYDAVDTRLGRSVALKILAADLDAPDELIREAQLAAALEHEHIVPVYEVGEHEGIVYFTMKRVDGGPLATPAPDARRAAEVLLSIAQAVEFAHRHGILHRDLKPTNVMVDGDGRPFVTDFGLASREGLAAGGALAPGGTPAYMAPEVWRGEPGAASTAADVWGAGAILYELLAGRPPFEASSWDELKRRVTEEPPQALEGIPADLAAVCLRCLEKDPARRYATAGELSGDLARFIAGEPVRARPLGVGARLLRRAARHPVIAGLVALLFLVALYTGITEYSLSRAQQAARRAELSRARAEQEALRTDLDRARAELEGLRSHEAARRGQQAALRSIDVAAHALARLTTQQFERYTAAVAAAGLNPRLARAIADPTSSEPSKICDRLLTERSGPTAGPFATWFLLDAEGTLIGHAPGVSAAVMGRSFKFRDYYRGAEELDKQGRRAAYVSRAYRSEGDGDFEIAISFTVRDAADRKVGLLVATIPTGSALGSIELDVKGGESFTAALLAPRGLERGEEVNDPESIFLVHRALARGEALRAQVGDVLGADLDGGALARLMPVQGTPFSVLVRVALAVPPEGPVTLPGH